MKRLILAGITGFALALIGMTLWQIVASSIRPPVREGPVPILFPKRQNPVPPTRVPAVHVPQASPPPAESERNLRMTPVVRAVQKAAPGVVNISTTQIVRQQVNPFGRFFADPFFERFFRDFFEPYYEEFQMQSLGSGFIIHPDGIIVTNYHVVQRATSIHVLMADRRKFTAEIIGAAPEHDIAVLKVNASESLPALEIGRSADLLVGEPVIAIGNPFGLSHSVTTGVVSALHRSIRAGDRVYHDFIQTDAPINPGNSGGPLLNIYGQVIGVNTAIYREAQGIGFAIPIDLVMRLVRDLLAFGHIRQTWWGMWLEPEGEDGRGLRVIAVLPESPAGRAGLRQGDRIIAIRGEPVRTLEDFYRIWSLVEPDQRVRVRFQRDGRTRTVQLRLRTFDRATAERLLLRLIGVGGTLVDPRVQQRYRLPTNTGWLILEVRGNSPAAEIGFRPGDLILQINGQPITDVSTLERAVLRLFQSTIATVRVFRYPYIYTVDVPLAGIPRTERKAVT